MSQIRWTAKASLQLWVRVSRKQCGDSRKGRLRRAIGELWPFYCLLSLAHKHPVRVRIVHTCLRYVQLLNAMLNLGDSCVHGFRQATIQ